MLFAVYEFAESKPTFPAKEIEDLDLLAGDMASTMASDSAEYSGDEDVPLYEKKRVGRDTERSKPTIPADDEIMTLISSLPEDKAEDDALLDVGKRTRRDTAKNSCVQEIIYKIIDNKAVKTVVCVDGCDEIRGIYYPQHRDEPQILTVDCKKKEKDTVNKVFSQ